MTIRARAVRTENANPSWPEEEELSEKNRRGGQRTGRKACQRYTPEIQGIELKKGRQLRG